jgi:hypothetical protein
MVSLAAHMKVRPVRLGGHESTFSIFGAARQWTISVTSSVKVTRKLALIGQQPFDEAERRGRAHAGR